VKTMYAGAGMVTANDLNGNFHCTF